MRVFYTFLFALVVGTSTLVAWPARAQPRDPAPAWLAPTQPPAAAPAPPARTFGWRSALLALVVIGLAGGAAYVRMRGGSGRITMGRGTLRVVDTARIGAGAQLVVAHVDGRAFLLGVTAQSVRRLATLPLPDAVDAVEPVNAAQGKAEALAVSGDPKARRSTFSKLLRKAQSVQNGPSRESAADVAAKETHDTYQPSTRSLMTLLEAEHQSEGFRGVEEQVAGLRRSTKRTRP